jgi:pimeloyl-ACP methyl ester carboxylesterase
MTTTGRELSVEVPGGRLWAEVAGEGSGVVFAHSAIADARMWDPQWDAVAARHRAVRFDLRGFYRSEVEHVAFSPRADLIAVMDAAGLDQAVLVGSSRGGSVALDTALEFPDRVTGLVWLCGGLSGVEHGDATAELDAYDAQEQAAEAAKDWDALNDIDVRIWVDGPRAPAGSGPADVRARISEMNLATLRAEKAYGDPISLDPPAAARLGELHIPVLVVVGLRDPLTTSRTADVIVAGAPNVRRIDLPDVAHFPNLERPAWLTETLLAFLAEVDAAAPGA